MIDLSLKYLAALLDYIYVYIDSFINRVHSTPYLYYFKDIWMPPATLGCCLARD